MDFLGIIKSELDPPGIDQVRWIALIEDHPNLVRPPSTHGIHPITKEPHSFYPPASTATVVFKGRKVGMMEWCQSGANEINVWGDPSIMASLAESIAPLLGGFFEKSDGG